MGNIKKNYKKINAIAKSLGLKRIVDGQYETKDGKHIDLSASGDERVQVWATIVWSMLVVCFWAVVILLLVIL